MAKQRKLTELVVQNDGTIKTSGWEAAKAVGRPFNIRTVGLWSGRPDKTYLERELGRRRMDFDAYCVGKGIDREMRDAPRGLPVDEVAYLTYPVQLYKVI